MILKSRWRLVRPGPGHRPPARPVRFSEGKKKLTRNPPASRKRPCSPGMFRPLRPSHPEEEPWPPSSLPSQAPRFPRDAPPGGTPRLYGRPAPAQAAEPSHCRDHGGYRPVGQEGVGYRAPASGRGARLGARARSRCSGETSEGDREGGNAATDASVYRRFQPRKKGRG